MNFYYKWRGKELFLLWLDMYIYHIYTNWILGESIVRSTKSKSK